jgi:hypothetical protein
MSNSCMANQNDAKRNAIIRCDLCNFGFERGDLRMGAVLALPNEPTHVVRLTNGRLYLCRRCGAKLLKSLVEWTKSTQWSDITRRD